MSDEPQPLPGVLKFLWMFFMQPVKLYHCLKACGIEKPGASVWMLRRVNKSAGKARRGYLARLMMLLLIGTPGLALGIAGIISLSGFDVSWIAVAMGITWGVAAGIVVGVALGVALGVAVGVAWGVTAGLTVGVALAGGVTGSMAGGMTLGAAFGMALGVATGATEGVASGVATGMAKGMVLAVALGVALGVTTSVIIGIAAGVGFIIFLWRIPVYVFEAIISLASYAIRHFSSINVLRFAPVLYHDLSYLPHPFLNSHLLLSAEEDPITVRRVLDACAIAPGQRRIGRNVLATLQARELDACARDRRFALLADPELTASDNAPVRWLPSPEAADPLLLAFREAARYLAAAQSSLPYHRLNHLLRAEAQLNSIAFDLLSSRSPLARALHPTLQTWHAVVVDMLEQAAHDAAGFLPNPFRPGNALDPEQGREVFRGRENTARQIESLLADPGQSLSIALLGPRRSGKSSLLKMLPALLPDAVCIFFDLQDHPTDSPAGFFRALARTARDQARRDRRLELPPLPEGSPFEAGSAWLRALDELAGNRRILLCIDEFERLESLFPGDHADLLRLMGLFRGTIQHRRRLRLLVSGAAPFEELSGMWNDHFINVQEIRLDLLDEPTSVELLRHPIPEFPDDAIPEPVAREVFARTGGQPLLLQAFGAALVSRLNDQQVEPRRATLADVDAVQELILQRYRPFFADTMNPEKIPPAARAALLALADNRAPELDARTRRWLRQRCLLTDDDRLRIPVLGAWIREE